MNSFIAPQIGFTLTGSSQGSQVYIGGNPSGSWEAIGLGYNGRPDPAERVIIDICQMSGVSVPTRRAFVSMNVVDLQAILASRPLAPGQFNLTLKEVLVCENNVTKGMVVLASQTYSTGSA